MIECTDKNVWYVKKRRLKKKRRFTILLILLIIICGYLYYHNLICAQIFRYCSDYSYSSSTDSVNKAVLNNLKDNVKYSDLILVDKNDNGDITLMSVNSYKVNMINREISLEASKILSEKLKNGIPIPCLAFTGVEMLSGYGKSVNIKTANVISVKSDFASTFKSVGLNQTLHSIYVEVVCEVIIELPFNSKTSQYKTSVLIGETILVGKVPDTYLNGKLFS